MSEVIELLIRLPELKARIGLSRSAIYSRLDPSSSQYDPTFPKPLKLGARCIAWRSSEVSAWIESRNRAARAA